MTRQLNQHALILWTILAAMLCGCSQAHHDAKLREGLPYFREVAPGIYCGGQPTAKGLKELRKLGVKTIIDLRTGMCGSNTPPDAPFERVQVPIVIVGTNDAQVEAFLRAVVEHKKPLYFHCLIGADRTGAMAAAYRMVVQNWTREQAMQEMQQLPAGVLCTGLVAYVQHMDVDGMRKRLAPQIGPEQPLAEAGPMLDAEGGVTGNTSSQGLTASDAPR